MAHALVRTPAELRTARQASGLTAEGLARMVRVEDGRTVRRWEAGERKIPGPVTVLLEAALVYLAQKKQILQQLEMSKSGSGAGRHTGNPSVDDVQEAITRPESAKTPHESALQIVMTLDGAIEMLTRTPPPGGVANQVHWYQLKTRSRKCKAPGGNDLSIPGELSCEAALAYFTKRQGFREELVICADPRAEYVLERRELLSVQHGSVQRPSAGKLVESFFVRRALRRMARR